MYEDYRQQYEDLVSESLSQKNDLEREIDQLREEVLDLKGKVADWQSYFLHIDDGARESGLTYEAVRDLVNKYLTEDEEKQISFGKLIEELRSMVRICAENMKNRNLET